MTAEGEQFVTLGNVRSAQLMNSVNPLPDQGRQSLARYANTQSASRPPGLPVIGMCYHERTVGEETSTEVRYFIGSKAAGAAYYGKALRNHWRIENCCHWQMDVTFGEDANRVSQRRAAENLALLRPLALSHLKQHPDKRSIKCKRLAACLDTKFLEVTLRSGSKKV